MTETCLRRLSQLLNHYLPSQAHLVSLDDLEQVFSTSRRNTSNILKMLDEYGWIEWSPGRGRGKASTLTVTLSLHQALYRTIRAELSSGNFDQISRLLELYRGTAASALNQAMEETSQANQSANALIISHYPWVNELNPALTYRFSELQVIRSLYDTLFKIDNNGHLHPHLACEYKVDGRCIYIWLRPDIRCHDGLMLESSDVIYSLNRLVQAKGPVSWLIRQVTSVTFCETEQAICIELSRPNPLFIYCLATANASVTTRRIREFSKNRPIAVGTGPFMAEYWEKDKLILKKHHQYFAKKALLDKITLSHQGEALDKYLSYNQNDGEKENYTIQAFSYLSHNRRPECMLSDESWQSLFAFLEARRFEFAANSDLDIMEMLEQTGEPDQTIPQLGGSLVLAHPKWTIDYLDKMSCWLVKLIEQTGLSVELVELSDASNPQLVKDQADLLLVEDIIEQPLEYGAYEWLLTGTGIRFAFDETQLDEHAALVQRHIAEGDTEQRLLEQLRQLRNNTTILPLFWGQEQVSCTKGVSGIQIGKSGYSDFYKLRIHSSNPDPEL